MDKRVWTKAKLVGELIEMHQKGFELRANVIAEYDSGLFGSIYYKGGNGKNKYFDSLNEARTIVANTLEDLGDKYGAKKVRKLNEPQISPTKYSSKKVYDIKKRTLEKFKRKIEAGEDVTIRGLRESDRQFASRLERYVGYHEAFKKLGLDHKDYARQVNHSGSHYLGQLIKHIKKGSNLNKKLLGEIDSSLVRNLDEHFDGYYNALRKAQEILSSKGREELAARADPDYWRRQLKEKIRGEREDNRKISLEKIIPIISDRIYEDGSLGMLETYDGASGKEIIAQARASGEWLTTMQVAERIKTTANNVSQYFPTKYPEHTIRYEQGDKQMYLFHVKMLEGHKRRNKTETSPKDSLNKTAINLGVSYAKLRSIADNLGLGEQNGNYRALSDGDKQTILNVLMREKELKNKIIAKIDPARDYSFSELEIMGIPISHLQREVRAGRLEAGDRKGVITVPGSYATEYFRDRYISGNLSQGLRLISFFHPNLHTSTDLIQQLNMTRDSVHQVLEVLLEENPECCFRLRKSAERSRIVATDEVMPYLRNWESRAGLQLISMASKLTASSSKKEVREAINETKKLVGEQNELRTKNQIDAFFVFKTLGDFLKQTVKVDGMNVSQRDLSRIYGYMVSHDYKTVEIGESLAVAQVGKMIDDSELIQICNDSRQKLGFALYQNNKGLIGNVKKVLGIKSELYDQNAEEKLMRAVELFDPTKGFKFSTYAFRTIENAFNRGFNGEISLDDPIGDKSKRINFIPDERQKVVGPLIESEDTQGIKKGVKEIILDLPQRLREVIIKRFGLRGRNKMTLEEIGFEMNITKERVRQLEEEALKKLIQNPNSEKLRKYLD